jgi:hypothetical protein
LIGFQAFINVAVVTSVLPNKGLPLPFISYGGSNLVMMLAIIGILLSIARHSHAAERRPAGAGEPERLPARRPRSNPFKESLRSARIAGKKTRTLQAETSYRSMIQDSWLAP